MMRRKSHRSGVPNRKYLCILITMYRYIGSRNLFPNSPRIVGPVPLPFAVPPNFFFSTYRECHLTTLSAPPRGPPKTMLRTPSRRLLFFSDYDRAKIEK